MGFHFNIRSSAHDFHFHFHYLFADHAVTNVEGGMYVSSEFQLGQVYIGEGEEPDDEVILYRPVYVCVPHEKIMVTNIDRESNMSRAGSRISMTRLNDRKFQLDSKGSKLKSEDSKHEDGADSPALERTRGFLSPDSASIDKYSDSELNRVESEETENSVSKAEVDINASAPEVHKTEEVTLFVEEVTTSDLTESKTFTNCNGKSVNVDTCNGSNATHLANDSGNKSSSQNVETVLPEKNDLTEISSCKQMYASDEPASINCDHTPEVILVQSGCEQTEMSEKT